MSWQPPRDLIGYAGRPPDPKWPDQARLALNLVLNYEEGSEASIGDGEAQSETALTEAGGVDQGMRGRDLGAESMFEYGSRVGFWRILRIFRERNLPMTVFGCALALERNPPAAQAIRDAGFDVCCHGWRWIKHYLLSEAEERDHISRAIASLSRTVGERPYGWYCRYAPSVNTRRLLVEAGGFLYDSDAYNDELPYWTVVQGKPHLILPYTLTNNDTKFVRAGMTTADEFFAFCRDAFDVLYREGKSAPKMMSVGLHMRLIGHPGRAAGLERFLDHVARHDGVWVTRRIDIARHWIATHPFTGNTSEQLI
ncbi:MAG: allantoinase PuuE [Alphaproteobacteria bacterium]|nr:allantoinase PuuE [Alphaproteobacteria bacterium]